jgi:hypothetical protein
MTLRAKTPASATLALAAVLAAPGAARAQIPTCSFRGAPEALAERPSPLDSVEIRLGDASAKLCYGRPSARGRTMIGGEDPYGTPWRLGANEPTTLHVPFAAEVGNVAVEPGSYTLYAIPGETAWTIVVNGNTNRWGIPINADVRSADIGSFEVTPARAGSYVETLTFRFEGGGASGALVFSWEDTTVRIPVRRR